MLAHPALVRLEPSVRVVNLLVPENSRQDVFLVSHYAIVLRPLPHMPLFSAVLHLHALKNGIYLGRVAPKCVPDLQVLFCTLE